MLQRNGFDLLQFMEIGEHRPTFESYNTGVDEDVEIVRTTACI